MKRESVRNGCLMAALLGSILVLGKAIARPQAGLLPQLSYDFPKTVPLANWQFVQNHPSELNRPPAPGFVTSVDDLAIATTYYRYLRNGKPLDVEMRYFSSSYSNVADILNNSTLTKNQTVGRDRKGWSVVQSPNGSYVLFQRSGKLHLSACITPFGRTTVEGREFGRDQNRIDVLATRVTPWLLGLTSLRDLRCMWTKMSVPSNQPDESTVNTNSQQVRDLEQAWVEWSQWWHKNYPPQS